LETGVFCVLFAHVECWGDKTCFKKPGCWLSPGSIRCSVSTRLVHSKAMKTPGTVERILLLGEGYTR